MSVKSPLRGLAQVNLPADDVAKARDWYAKFLGVEPYFQRPDEKAPAYVEFRIGDTEDELGIIDSKFLPKGSGGAIARWHVDDLKATLAKLKDLGAKENEPLTEREGGFATASVVDPFGNILGLIHSPHYDETVKKAA
jgi:predicted enzyme related to lactoylglutathione lyase